MGVQDSEFPVKYSSKYICRIVNTVTIAVETSATLHAIDLIILNVKPPGQNVVC